MKSIKFTDDIVKKNRIPILIYTPEWLQNFSDNMDKDMEKTKKELENVLQREKDIETEMSEKDGRKKSLMRKVLYVSQEINQNQTPGADLIMDETKKEISEINEELPILMEELEEIPNIINEKNTEVLKATIKRGFAIITEYKNECDEFQIECIALRARLEELAKLKLDSQKKAQKLYYFMYSWIGKKEMEKLDDKVLADFLKEPRL